MEERSERYKRRLRRRRLPYFVVGAAALVILVGVVLFVVFNEPPSDQKGTTPVAENDSADTKDSEKDSQKESEPQSDSESGSESQENDTQPSDPEPGETSDSDTDPEDQSSSEADSGTEPDSETQTESEPGSETEPTSETPTETQPTREVDLDTQDYSRVVFVGDSRTMAMASGGTYEYELVPDDNVFATWGGRLVESSAHKDAMAAALEHREKAVFWFGINDIQLNYDRDEPGKFAEYYDSVLATYRNTFSGSQIYIVSILNTGVEEQDYYDGQEENIRKCNEVMQQYCKDHDYIYLDATPLLVGEEGLLADHIHFSKEWYEQKYLPYIINAIGI